MSTMDLVAQLVELWTNELEIMSSKPSLTLLEKTQLGVGPSRRVDAWRLQFEQKIIFLGVEEAFQSSLLVKGL